MALMFLLLMAVRHPSVPLCECVTSTPGPILSKSAATAFVFTSTSYGPVFGAICRKNWSSARGSRENCTRIEVRPDAQPEDPEPQLIVGRGGNGARLRAAGRAAASWLIHRISSAQKHGLEAFASVRRRSWSWRTADRARTPKVCGGHSPALDRRRACDRRATSVPAGRRRGRPRPARSAKRAGRGHDGPADREAALLLNGKRSDLARIRREAADTPRCQRPAATM